MSELRHQATSGIKFSALSQAGRQGIQILTTIILARVLTPSDFGLLNMALIIVGFAMVFKDAGTSAAIIQKKELSDELCSSIFWLNIGVGLFLMLAIILCAPLAGLYYQEARVTPVLRVLSISFFAASFGFVHQALLERELSFSSLARLEVLSVVAGGLVGVAMALLGAGVWSLVLQTLMTTFVSTVLLWVSSSWRPQWNFHWVDVKVVGSFSLNLAGFNVFNYFARNADYLLIGRYLGAQDLGFYTLAYRILLFPLQNISAVVGRVMYPVLSSLQDDDEKFKSIYLKVIRSIAFISFPLMTAAFALAESLVLTIFGSKWQPVSLLVMILVPVGLIQSIGTTVGTIYQVKGRTDWMFRWGIGSGIFVVAVFVVGLRWGIVGVATAYAIAVGVLLYPSFAIPFHLIGLRFSAMLRALIPSLLASGLMLVGVWLFRSVLPASLSNAVILLLSIIFGCMFYLLMGWLTNREQLKELLNLAGFSRRRSHEAG
ncbi:MAG: MOP flippase family protein [Anaerolineae bacterium]|nr:MOP flippase family protein [Anaerolineae bacterium]